MDTIADRIEDRFISVDGLALRYIEAGEGPALVLLHGASLGSSADVFARNLGPLSEAGFRAIAFDQPGFGLSDIPPDHGPAYRRRSILAFMDALGLETATLAGHSQAGNFAFTLAEEHPDRIASVIVLGTGSLLPPLPGGQAKKAPAEGREGTPCEPALDDTRRLLEANLFHRDLVTDEALALRHARSIGRNFEAYIERGLVPREKGRTEGPPAWQRLATAPVPLLLIYGREDRASACERAMLLGEQFPSLDLHIVDGCRHLVPWDAADEWVRLAVNFLKATGTRRNLG